MRSSSSSGCCQSLLAEDEVVAVKKERRGEDGGLVYVSWISMLKGEPLGFWKSLRVGAAATTITTVPADHTASKLQQKYEIGDSNSKLPRSFWVFTFCSSF